jgi:hypothetical protein
MANFVMCDEMLAELLDEQTGHSAAHGWDGALVMLFLNNLTPSKTTVKADLTTEASFAGYTRLTLAAANFPAASVAGDVASSVYAVTLTWTRSTSGTAQTVYGMAVLNSAGTKIIAAGNFDGGPYVIANAGDAINEVLTVRRSSEF